MGVAPRWSTGNSAIAQVYSPGGVRAVGKGMTMVVASAGGISDSAAITVDAPSFTVSGTVSDRRIPGMVLPSIVMQLDNWERRYTRTGPDGRYRFEDVGGKVSVTAERESSYVSQTVEVGVAADLTLDFELEHTGTPPFAGTPWINPSILGLADSTSLRSVTYAGRGLRTIFDRRNNLYFDVNAYLFDVQLGEREVEFQVNPELGNINFARTEVQKFAPALGRLPAVFFSNLGAVMINSGEGAWGGSSQLRSILVHTQDRGTAVAIRDGFLEEVFVHEAAHVSLDVAHGASPGWLAAQDADGVFISDYAQTHPDREDIAESILMYFAVRYMPERLDQDDRWAILTAIPNRLAYFEEQDFDMSPYEATGSLVPGFEPGSVASGLQRTVLATPEAAAVLREVTVAPREEGTCQWELEDPAQPWAARKYPQELLDGPCALPGVAGSRTRPH